MVRAVVVFSALTAASSDSGVPVMGPYLISTTLSNDCPDDAEPIFDESECRDAAASVGGNYQGAGDWSDHIGGCYGNPLTSQVWLNQNQGQWHVGYAKVCRKNNPNGDVKMIVNSGGLERTGILHIPQGVTGQIPLVVDNHAWGNDPFFQAALTNFISLADREGFAVLYPHGYDEGQPIAVFQMPLPGGIGYSFNAGACCPKSSTNVRDDVTFVRDLVQHAEELLPKTTKGSMQLDRSRVYATGMSNGGFLTNRLACQARDLFAAVAPVAGILVNGNSPTWGGDPFECPPHDPPLPVLHFHGKADGAVPWDGNAMFGFSSIDEYRNTRLRLNGLPEGDQGTTTYANGDVTCTAHGPHEANFTFCAIEGGGHTWPGSTYLCPESEGGFHCTRDIDATVQIWEFFKRYNRQTEAIV